MELKIQQAANQFFEIFHTSKVTGKILLQILQNPYFFYISPVISHIPYLNHLSQFLTIDLNYPGLKSLVFILMAELLRNRFLIPTQQLDFASLFIMHAQNLDLYRNDWSVTVTVLLSLQNLIFCTSQNILAQFEQSDNAEVNNVIIIIVDWLVEIVLSHTTDSEPMQISTSALMIFIRSFSSVRTLLRKHPKASQLFQAELSLIQNNNKLISIDASIIAMNLSLSDPKLKFLVLNDENIRLIAHQLFTFLISHFQYRHSCDASLASQFEQIDQSFSIHLKSKQQKNDKQNVIDEQKQIKNIVANYLNRHSKVDVITHACIGILDLLHMQPNEPVKCALLDDNVQYYTQQIGTNTNLSILRTYFALLWQTIGNFNSLTDSIQHQVDNYLNEDDRIEERTILISFLIELLTNSWNELKLIQKELNIDKFESREQSSSSKWKSSRTEELCECWWADEILSSLFIDIELPNFITGQDQEQNIQTFSQQQIINYQQSVNISNPDSFAIRIFSVLIRDACPSLHSSQSQENKINNSDQLDSIQQIRFLSHSKARYHFSACQNLASLIIIHSGKYEYLFGEGLIQAGLYSEDESCLTEAVQHACCILQDRFIQFVSLQLNALQDWEDQISAQQNDQFLQFPRDNEQQSASNTLTTLFNTSTRKSQQIFPFSILPADQETKQEINTPDLSFIQPLYSTDVHSLKDRELKDKIPIKQHKDKHVSFDLSNTEGNYEDNNEDYNQQERNQIKQDKNHRMKPKKMKHRNMQYKYDDEYNDSQSSHHSIYRKPNQYNSLVLHQSINPLRQIISLSKHKKKQIGREQQRNSFIDNNEYIYQHPDNNKRIKRTKSQTSESSIQSDSCNQSDYSNSSLSSSIIHHHHNNDDTSNISESDLYQYIRITNSFKPPKINNPSRFSSSNQLKSSPLNQLSNLISFIPQTSILSSFQIIKHMNQETIYSLASIGSNGVISAGTVQRDLLFIMRLICAMSEVQPSEQSNNEDSVWQNYPIGGTFARFLPFYSMIQQLNYFIQRTDGIQRYPFDRELIKTKQNVSHQQSIGLQSLADWYICTIIVFLTLIADKAVANPCQFQFTPNTQLYNSNVNQTQGNSIIESEYSTFQSSSQYIDTQSNQQNSCTCRMHVMQAIQQLLLVNEQRFRKAVSNTLGIKIQNSNSLSSSLITSDPNQNQEQGNSYFAQIILSLLDQIYIHPKSEQSNESYINSLKQQSVLQRNPNNSIFEDNFMDRPRVNGYTPTRLQQEEIDSYQMPQNVQISQQQYYDLSTPFHPYQQNRPAQDINYSFIGQTSGFQNRNSSQQFPTDKRPMLNVELLSPMNK